MTRAYRRRETKLLEQAEPNHIALLRGGRLTKIAGVVASYAPQLGAVASAPFRGLSVSGLSGLVLGGQASTAALAVAGALTYATAADASCVADPAPTANGVICEGVVTDTIAYAGPSGFSVETSDVTTFALVDDTADAVNIDAGGDIQVDDEYAGSVFQGANGIVLSTTGSDADIAVSIQGSIEGEDGVGLSATTDGDDSSIDVTLYGDVTAATDGVVISHNGDSVDDQVYMGIMGDVTGGDNGIVITGDSAIAVFTSSDGPIVGGPGDISDPAATDNTITGTAGRGINVTRVDGSGDVLIGAENVTGGTDGIVVSTTGSGVTAVRVNGNVSGQNGQGLQIDANTGNESATGVVFGTVTGSENGVVVTQDGDGGVGLFLQGDVTGTEGVGITVSNMGTGDAVGGPGGSGYTIEEGTIVSVGKYGPPDPSAEGTDVSGGTDGIVIHTANGPTAVLVSGDVTGQAGDGIRITTGPDMPSVGPVEESGVAVIVLGDVTGADGAGITVTNYGEDTGPIGGPVYGPGFIEEGTFIAVGPKYGYGGPSIAATAPGMPMPAPATSNVTGATDGIAVHTENGPTQIAVYGDVTGQDGDGIRVTTGLGGEDVTVGVYGATSGTENGVDVNNSGTGETRIETIGAVSGDTEDGIIARNTIAGGAMTIEAGSTVTGAERGIFADHEGSGALTIEAAGDVTGTAQEGINAQTTVQSDGLSIEVAGVTGETTGINAQHRGYGDLTITATGDVTGTSYTGIFADSGSLSTNMSITTQAVNGGGFGIEARHGGDGALTITANGAVTATGDDLGKYGDAIFARNGDGTTTTITTEAAVTGYYTGIYAAHDGDGDLTITANDAVTGTNSDGIYADVDSEGDITITAQGLVTAGDDGIGVYSEGESAITIQAASITADDDGVDVETDDEDAGDVSVTVSGPIIAGDNGIDIGIEDSDATSDVTVSVANITSVENGVHIDNEGEGNTEITVGGVILAGEDGVDLDSSSGSENSITLLSGASVTGGSDSAYHAIIDRNGDTTVALMDGSTLAGSISLGGGDDFLLIGDADITAGEFFDGGDDNFTDMTVEVAGTPEEGDILAFQADQTVAGANLRNWEFIAVGDDQTLTLTDNVLTLGRSDGLSGLYLFENATLALASGDTTITGNVISEGSIDLTNDGAGDSVVVTGDFETDGGVFALDVALGDSASPADTVTIQGDATGNGLVQITNTGGVGALTSGEGIGIITVDGTNDMVLVLDSDEFSVEGDPIVTASIFGYRLVQDADDNWALSSFDTSDERIFTPTAAAVESLPSILVDVAPMRGFRDRLGGRLGRLQNVVSQNAIDLNTSRDWSQTRAVATFAEVLGQRNTVTPDSTTAGTRSAKTNTYGLVAGVDAVLSDGQPGTLYGSFSVIGAKSSSDVVADLGSRSVDTDTFGVNVSASWVGNSGVYVEGQAQLTTGDTKITDNAGTTIGEGINSRTTSVSLEVGKTTELASGLSLTPQFQLMHSVQSVDSFVDNTGTTVRFDDVKQTTARLGIEARQGLETSGGSVTVFGLANVIHDLDAASRSVVSGIELDQVGAETRFELGFGLTSDIRDNVSLSGALRYETGIDGTGEDETIKANFGLRISF